KTRERVPRLRARRHGADFDEAETEAQQRVGDQRVLVEPRSHPDRIGKREAECRDREPRVVDRRPRARREAQRGKGERMRILGIDEAQQRSGQAIESTKQGESPRLVSLRTMKQARLALTARKL